MGWSRFRLYDQDVGAAVTAVGREVIKFTEKIVKELGYEVIYGDTDSVLVKLGPDYTKDQVKQIGFELEKEINEAYDRFAKEELNADEHFFDIEFEKLYRTFFQAGKKKRYAGHITWKEGKEEDSLDIVGFEYQRSDYSKVAKQLMKRVFNHILRGGELDDISQDVTEVIDKLKDGEYGPDEFGIPASVTKDFDDYDTDTVAVKGSKYTNRHFDGEIQPGDKPKMNYVKKILPDGDGVVQHPMPDEDRSKSQPCCWMIYNNIPDVVEWDWDEYIDKQIKSPISRILQGTDWSWAEVVTGQRQPRLGEYKFEDEASDDDGGAVVFSKPDPTESVGDDFDDEDLSPWEREEMEAKQALSDTQDMLDGWEGKGVDDEQIVTANMKDLDDGPTDLDDFI
jgi:DNA polymerase elongation subunit (family B)